MSGCLNGGGTVDKKTLHHWVDQLYRINENMRNNVERTYDIVREINTKQERMAYLLEQSGSTDQPCCSKNKHLHCEMDNMMIALKTEKESVEQLRNLVRTIEKENNHLRDDLDQAKVKLDGKEEEEKELSRVIDEMLAALGEKDKQLAELTEEIEIAQSDNGKRETELRRALNNIGQKEEHILDLKAKIRVMKMDFEEERTRIIALERQNVEQLKATLAFHRSEINDLKDELIKRDKKSKRIAELEATLRIKESELINLRNDLENLIESAQMERTKSLNKIETMKERNNALEVYAEKLRMTIACQDGKIHHISAAIERDPEIDVYTYKEIDNENHRLREETDSLEERLQTVGRQRNLLFTRIQEFEQNEKRNLARITELQLGEKLIANTKSIQVSSYEKDGDNGGCRYLQKEEQPFYSEALREICKRDKQIEELLREREKRLDDYDFDTKNHYLKTTISERDTEIASIEKKYKESKELAEKKDGEILEWKTKCQELNAHLKVITREFDDINNMYNESKMQLSSLKSAKESLNDKLEDIARLKRTIANLESHLKDRDETIAMHESDNRELKKKLKNLINEQVMHEADIEEMERFRKDKQITEDARDKQRFVKEYEYYKQQNVDLENHLRDCKEIIEHLKEVVDSYEGEQLQKDHASNPTKVEYEKQLQQLRDQISDRERQSIEYERKLNEKEVHLQFIKLAKETHVESIAHLETINEKLQVENRDLQLNLQKMEYNNQNQAEKYKDMKSQISHQNEELHDLRRENGKLSTEVQNKKEHLETIKEKLQAENRDLQLNLQKVKCINQNLAEKYEEIKSQISHQNEELHDLRREKDKLSTEVKIEKEDLEAIKENLQAENRDLQLNLQKMKYNNQNQAGKCEEIKSQISHQNEELHDLRREKGKLSTEVQIEKEHLEAVNEKLQTENRDLQLNLQKMKCNNQNMAENCEDIKSQISHQNEELHDLRREKGKLSTEVKIEKEHLETIKEKLQAENRDLQLNLQKMKCKNQNLAEKCEGIKSQISHQNEELHDLRREKGKLSTEVQIEKEQVKRFSMLQDNISSLMLFTQELNDDLLPHSSEPPAKEPYGNLTKVHDQMQTMKASIKELNETNKELKREKNELDISFKKLKQILEEKSKKLEILKQENKELKKDIGSSNRGGLEVVKHLESLIAKCDDIETEMVMKKVKTDILEDEKKKIQEEKKTLSDKLKQNKGKDEFDKVFKELESKDKNIEMINKALDSAHSCNTNEMMTMLSDIRKKENGITALNKQLENPNLSHMEKTQIQDKIYTKENEQVYLEVQLRNAQLDSQTDKLEICMQNKEQEINLLLENLKDPYLNDKEKQQLQANLLQKELDLFLFESKVMSAELSDQSPSALQTLIDYKTRELSTLQIDSNSSNLNEAEKEILKTKIKQKQFSITKLEKCLKYSDIGTKSVNELMTDLENSAQKLETLHTKLQIPNISNQQKDETLLEIQNITQQVALIETVLKNKYILNDKTEDFYSRIDNKVHEIMVLKAQLNDSHSHSEEREIKCLIANKEREISKIRKLVNYTTSVEELTELDRKFSNCVKSFIRETRNEADSRVESLVLDSQRKQEELKKLEAMVKDPKLSKDKIELICEIQHKHGELLTLNNDLKLAVKEAGEIRVNDLRSQLPNKSSKIQKLEQLLHDSPLSVDEAVKLTHQIESETKELVQLENCLRKVVKGECGKNIELMATDMKRTELEIQTLENMLEDDLLTKQDKNRLVTTIEARKCKFTQMNSEIKEAVKSDGEDLVNLLSDEIKMKQSEIDTLETMLSDPTMSTQNRDTMVTKIENNKKALTELKKELRSTINDEGDKYVKMLKADVKKTNSEVNKLKKILANPKLSTCDKNKLIFDLRNKNQELKQFNNIMKVAVKDQGEKYVGVLSEEVNNKELEIIKLENMLNDTSLTSEDKDSIIAILKSAKQELALLQTDIKIAVNDETEKLTELITTDMKNTEKDIHQLQTMLKDPTLSNENKINLARDNIKAKQELTQLHSEMKLVVREMDDKILELLVKNVHTKEIQIEKLENTLFNGNLTKRVKNRLITDIENEKRDLRKLENKVKLAVTAEGSRHVQLLQDDMNTKQREIHKLENLLKSHSKSEQDKSSLSKDIETKKQELAIIHTELKETKIKEGEKNIEILRKMMNTKELKVSKIETTLNDHTLSAEDKHKLMSELEYAKLEVNELRDEMRLKMKKEGDRHIQILTNEIHCFEDEIDHLEAKLSNETLTEKEKHRLINDIIDKNTELTHLHTEANDVIKQAGDEYLEMLTTDAKIKELEINRLETMIKDQVFSTEEKNQLMRNLEYHKKELVQLNEDMTQAARENGEKRVDFLTTNLTKKNLEIDKLEILLMDDKLTTEDKTRIVNEMVKKREAMEHLTVEIGQAIQETGAKRVNILKCDVKYKGQDIMKLEDMLNKHSLTEIDENKILAEMENKNEDLENMRFKVKHAVQDENKKMIEYLESKKENKVNEIQHLDRLLHTSLLSTQDKDKLGLHIERAKQDLEQISNEIILQYVMQEDTSDIVQDLWKTKEEISSLKNHVNDPELSVQERNKMQLRMETKIKELSRINKKLRFTAIVEEDTEKIPAITDQLKTDIAFYEDILHNSELSSEEKHKLVSDIKTKEKELVKLNDKMQMAAIKADDLETVAGDITDTKEEIACLENALQTRQFSDQTIHKLQSNITKKKTYLAKLNDKIQLSEICKNEAEDIVLDIEETTEDIALLTFALNKPNAGEDDKQEMLININTKVQKLNNLQAKLKLAELSKQRTKQEITDIVTDIGKKEDEIDELERNLKESNLSSSEEVSINKTLENKRKEVTYLEKKIKILPVDSEFLTAVQTQIEKREQEISTLEQKMSQQINAKERMRLSKEMRRKVKEIARLETAVENSCNGNENVVADMEENSSEVEKEIQDLKFKLSNDNMSKEEETRIRAHIMRKEDEALQIKKGVEIAKSKTVNVTNIEANIRKKQKTLIELEEMLHNPKLSQDEKDRLKTDIEATEDEISDISTHLHKNSDQASFWASIKKKERQVSILKTKLKDPNMPDFQKLKLWLEIDKKERDILKLETKLKLLNITEEEAEGMEEAIFNEEFEIAKLKAQTKDSRMDKESFDIFKTKIDRKMRKVDMLQNKLKQANISKEEPLNLAADIERKESEVLILQQFLNDPEIKDDFKILIKSDIKQKQREITEFETKLNYTDADNEDIINVVSAIETKEKEIQKFQRIVLNPNYTLSEKAEAQRQIEKKQLGIQQLENIIIDARLDGDEINTIGIEMKENEKEITMLLGKLHQNGLTKNEKNILKSEILNKRHSNSYYKNKLQNADVAKTFFTRVETIFEEKQLEIKEQKSKLNYQNLTPQEKQKIQEEIIDKEKDLHKLSTRLQRSTCPQRFIHKVEHKEGELLAIQHQLRDPLLDTKQKAKLRNTCDLKQAEINKLENKLKLIHVSDKDFLILENNLADKELELADFQVKMNDTSVTKGEKALIKVEMDRKIREITRIEQKLKETITDEVSVLELESEIQEKEKEIYVLEEIANDPSASKEEVNQLQLNIDSKKYEIQLAEKKMKYAKDNRNEFDHLEDVIQKTQCDILELESALNHDGITNEEKQKVQAKMQKKQCKLKQLEMKLINADINRNSAAAIRAEIESNVLSMALLESQVNDSTLTMKAKTDMLKDIQSKRQDKIKLETKLQAAVINLEADVAKRAQSIETPEETLNDASLNKDAKLKIKDKIAIKQRELLRIESKLKTPRTSVINVLGEIQDEITETTEEIESLLRQLRNGKLDNEDRIQIRDKIKIKNLEITQLEMRLRDTTSSEDAGDIEADIYAIDNYVQQLEELLTTASIYGIEKVKIKGKIEKFANEKQKLKTKLSNAVLNIESNIEQKQIEMEILKEQLVHGNILDSEKKEEIQKSVGKKSFEIQRLVSQIAGISCDKKGIDVLRQNIEARNNDIDLLQSQLQDETLPELEISKLNSKVERKKREILTMEKKLKYNDYPINKCDVTTIGNDLIKNDKELTRLKANLCNPAVTENKNLLSEQIKKKEQQVSILENKLQANVLEGDATKLIDEEITEMEEEVSLLTSKLNNEKVTKEEKEEIKNSIIAKENDIFCLKKKFNTSRKSMEVCLKRKINKQEDEISKVIKSLQDSSSDEKKLQSIKEEIKEKQSEVRKLNLDLKYVKSSTCELLSDIAKKDDEIERLKQHLKETKQEQDSFTAFKTESHKMLQEICDIESLREMLREKEREIEQERKENLINFQKLKENSYVDRQQTDQTISELKIILAKRDSIITETNKTKLNLEQELEKLSHLMSNNADTSSYLSQMEDKAKKLEKSLSELHIQLETNTKLQSIVEEKDRCLKDANDKLQDLNSQFVALKTEYETVLKMRAMLAQNLKDMGEKIENEFREIKEIITGRGLKNADANDNKQLEEHYKILKAIQEKSQNQVMELTEENKTLKENANQNSEDAYYAQELSRKNEEIKDKGLKIAELEKELEKTCESLEFASVRAANDADKINDLKSKGNEFEQIIKELQEHLGASESIYKEDFAKQLRKKDSQLNHTRYQLTELEKQLRTMTLTTEGFMREGLTDTGLQESSWELGLSDQTNAFSSSLLRSSVFASHFDQLNPEGITSAELEKELHDVYSTAEDVHRKVKNAEGQIHSMKEEMKHSQDIDNEIAMRQIKQSATELVNTSVIKALSSELSSAKQRVQETSVIQIEQSASNLVNTSIVNALSSELILAKRQAKEQKNKLRRTKDELTQIKKIASKEHVKAGIEHKMGAHVAKELEQTRNKAAIETRRSSILTLQVEEEQQKVETAENAAERFKEIVDSEDQVLRQWESAESLIETVWDHDDKNAPLPSAAKRMSVGEVQVLPQNRDDHVHAEYSLFRLETSTEPLNEWMDDKTVDSNNEHDWSRRFDSDDDADDRELRRSAESVVSSVMIGALSKQVLLEKQKRKSEKREKKQVLQQLGDVQKIASLERVKANVEHQMGSFVAKELLQTRNKAAIETRRSSLLSDQVDQEHAKAVEAESTAERFREIAQSEEYTLSKWESEESLLEEFWDQEKGEQAPLPQAARQSIVSVHEINYQPRDKVHAEYSVFSLATSKTPLNELLDGEASFQSDDDESSDRNRGSAILQTV